MQHAAGSDVFSEAEFVRLAAQVLPALLVAVAVYMNKKNTKEAPALNAAMVVILCAGLLAALFGSALNNPPPFVVSFSLWSCILGTIMLGLGMTHHMWQQIIKRGTAARRVFLTDRILAVPVVVGIIFLAIWMPIGG